MLLKRVCPHCGHHYLADEQVDEVDCPRCHAPVDGGGADLGTGGGMPGMVSPVQPQSFEGSHTTVLREPRFSDQYAEAQDEEFTGVSQFAPLAPPPMFVTIDRVLRGVILGSLAALALGSVIGAALGAVRFMIPVLPALLLGSITGVSCRRAFGGRAARGTRARAALVVFACLLFGYIGVAGGAWLVDRLVGLRVEQTRDDLDRGLRSLTRQRGHMTDEGTSILLDQRIARVRELQGYTGAELEDYLWVQEAQVNQPFLAYLKLRATRGPVLRLGAEAEPVKLRKELTMAALAAEILIGALLGMFLVTPRRF